MVHVRRNPIIRTRNPLRRRGNFGDVIGPLVDSLEYSEGVNGPTAKARWIVNDIGGPPQLVLPIAVHAAGIPRVGSTYADMPELPVSRVTAVLAPDSTTKAIVTVEWATPSADGNLTVIDPGETVSQAQIEINSTIQGSTTRFDVEGNPLIVEQEFEFRVGQDETAFQTIKEWKEIEVNQSLHVVRFTRMERGSPGRFSTRFVNHTNGTVVFGDQPGMWLCTGLDGSSNDNGETYRVVYEFQRAPELHPVTEEGIPIFPEPPMGTPEPLLGWGTVIQLTGSFLTDGSLALLASALRAGEGIRAVRNYHRVDFRELPELDFGAEA